MTKYVKKPETIEAFQFPEVTDIDRRMEMEDWIEKHKGPEQEFLYIGENLKINLSGMHLTMLIPGDWLIVSFDKIITSLRKARFEKEYSPEKVTIINVDARGAEQGVEEKIREAMEDALPRLKEQTIASVTRSLDYETRKRADPRPPVSGEETKYNDSK